LKDELNIPHAHIVEKISGKDMEHIKYVHPLYNNLISPVILADYVTNQGGSGLVHNASGFGKEDYIACKKYGIKPYAPIGADGKFTDECHDKTLVGKFYESTNDEIIQRLKIANCLLKADKITHSVALD
jgi:isoleucyl-tRNA synthetase